ncbi:SHOCT domain-containing protein [Thiomicrorhabdus sp.]|uniref:SHOCT domain-containing protein n=1 Tax=Thiomicrorhabdus sp. TaxID=2039724 RepID=UPI0029C802F9|nr:SHOCT domain-containing protein [Thiomicrorhabdus sp.]
MNWEYMNHGYFGGFMWLWFLLIVLIIIALFFPWWKQGASANNSKDEVDEKPLQILQKRFARGEISEEEYQSMRKTLEDD